MPKTPPPTTTLNRKPTPKNPRGRLPPSRKPPRPGNKTAKSSTPNEPGHSSKPCAPKRNNSRRRRSRQQRQSPRRRPQNLPRKRAPKNPSRKEPAKAGKTESQDATAAELNKVRALAAAGVDIALAPYLPEGTPEELAEHIELLRAHPRSRGNTHCPEAQRRNFRAHPHTRGEHVSHPRRFNEKKGSSPLPRGTQCPLIAGTPPLGLIPARAGNTLNRH